MSEYDHFEHDPNLELAAFGLNGEFIHNLSPADFRLVISSIARAAAIARHTDHGHAEYDFGTTDVRELTAFAGKVAHMADDEVVQLQAGYSDDEVVGTYRRQVRQLGDRVDVQRSEIRNLKALAMELLIPEASGETIGGFEGVLFCGSSNLLSSKMLVLDLNLGGQLRSAREIYPLHQQFVDEAEPWIGEVYAEAQKRTNNEAPTVYMVQSGETSVVAKFDDETVDVAELGIDPADSLDRPSPNMAPQLFKVTPSMDRRTGAIQRPAVVFYSRTFRRQAISSNTHLVGFADNEQLTLRHMTPSGPSFGLPALPRANQREADEFGTTALSRVASSTFLQGVLDDRQFLTRSLRAPNTHVPVLFDPEANSDVLFVAGPYHIAVPKSPAS